MRQSAPLLLRTTAFVKSHTARAASGLLTNAKEAADEYYRRRLAESERRRAEDAARGRPPPPEREGSGGFRWAAKWAAYRTVSRVEPQSRRLLMLVAASGMQARLGGTVACDDGVEGESRGCLIGGGWVERVGGVGG